MCHEPPAPDELAPALAEKTMEDADRYFRSVVMVWEELGGKPPELAFTALTYATLWLAKSGSPEAARKAFDAVLKSMVLPVAVNNLGR